MTRNCNVQLAALYRRIRAMSYKTRTSTLSSVKEEKSCPVILIQITKQTIVNGKFYAHLKKKLYATFFVSH